MSLLGLIKAALEAVKLYFQVRYVGEAYRLTRESQAIERDLIKQQVKYRDSSDQADQDYADYLRDQIVREKKIQEFMIPIAEKNLDNAGKK